MNFTATRVPSVVCTPAQTEPIPPRPSRSVTRYLPATRATGAPAEAPGRSDSATVEKGNRARSEKPEPAGRPANKARVNAALGSGNEARGHRALSPGLARRPLPRGPLELRAPRVPRHR